MSQPNAANVVVALTGAVYVADVGAPAPTGATDPLGPQWQHLGYISAQGVTESHTVSSDALRAWQSDRVRTIVSKYQVDYSFECLETRWAVLERYYGFKRQPALQLAGAPRRTQGRYEPTYTPEYPGGLGTDGYPDHIVGGVAPQYMAMVVDVIDHTTMAIRRYAPRAVFVDRDQVKMGEKDAIKYPFVLEALPDTSLGGSVQVFYSRVL